MNTLQKTETDLFSTPELWPENVAQVLSNYEDGEQDYATCEKMIKELETIGYTADYGLDAGLYDLRKI